MIPTKPLLLTLVLLQVASSAAYARIAFTPAEPFRAANKPDMLATGDFNRDGRADVVVMATASKELDILISAPEGGFVRGTVLPMFITSMNYLVVGDINQDTLDDIVVADKRGPYQKGRIWFLLGRGDGSFRDPYSIEVSNSPFSLVLADLEADGDVDIVFTDKTTQQLYVLINDGGNPPLFTPGGMLALAKKPEELIKGQFRRNGNLDLMALNTGGPKGKDVTFVRNDGVNTPGGPLTLTEAGQFMVGTNPWAMLGADADGDGLTDAVMLNKPTGRYADSQLEFLFTRGNGLFDGPLDVTLPCPELESGFYCYARLNKHNLAAADFDRDGITDYVLTQQKYDIDQKLVTQVFMRVVRGLPNRRFLPKFFINVPAGPYAVAAADFNGDGWPDVVLGTQSDSKVTTYLNVSTTPAGPGEPCIDAEDCQSETCLGGLCCEDICPSPDYTCAVPGFEGECYRLRDNGEVCTYDIECLSAHCTDGVCCDVTSCPEGQRCSICGLEGTCHEPLMPGEPCCDDDLSCDPTYCKGDGISEDHGGCCTDGVCCRQRVCPDGDLCSPPDGFCMEPPTPTPTRTGQGGDCDVDQDCQPGLFCVNGICCNERCKPGYFCSEEQDGVCVKGTSPPTRTPTPTRIPSTTPIIPTPTCPPGFEPSGGLCTSVSRGGGGCAIMPGSPPSTGATLVLLLVPAALWLARRRRRGE
jgi:hypothetical protein